MLHVLFPQVSSPCSKASDDRQVFWLYTYLVKVQHQKLWCTVHTGKATKQRSLVLPAYRWWSVNQCYESHLHIPEKNKLEVEQVNQKSNAFVLTVVITRFHKTLLTRGKWCPQLEEIMMVMIIKGKTLLACPIRTPGNHFNTSLENNLNQLAHIAIWGPLSHSLDAVISKDGSEVHVYKAGPERAFGMEAAMACTELLKELRLHFSSATPRMFKNWENMLDLTNLLCWG